MPYRRNYGKVVKRKRAKKGGASKANYRPTIPRTIQIATKRNKNMRLRFTINQSYVFDNTNSIVGDSIVLCYRANSLVNSQIATSVISGLWNSQDPVKYSNLVADAISQNADGFDKWSESFQHFCVSGSKMSVTFEPAGSGVPATLFTHTSGIQGLINTTTKSARLNELPYIHRAAITTSGISMPSAAGARLAQKYSARKFEGVTDPNDNSNLRGTFNTTTSTPITPGHPPGEQTYFYVALAPVDPNTTGKLPSGVFRIKVEYIAHLKEPTESNDIQLQLENRYKASGWQ